MIFVTVGTHEQTFNRLVESIDKLKENETIKETVIIQTGYSTYSPKYCKWYNLIPYNDMKNYINDARIVITHGGPSSFIMPIQMGKVPIVVPRQKIYNEHVNDHQVDFVKAVSQKQNSLIPVYDIERLQEVILNYDSIIQNMPSTKNSNNQRFNIQFDKIVDNLFGFGN